MSTQPDRRHGGPDGAPGVRTWGAAHPVGAAVVQGLMFGILFGVYLVLTSPGELGLNVALAAVAGVVFGLLMWVFARARRRRAART